MVALLVLGGILGDLQFCVQAALLLAYALMQWGKTNARAHTHTQIVRTIKKNQNRILYDALLFNSLPYLMTFG